MDPMRALILAGAMLLAAPLTAHAQAIDVGALDPGTSVVTVTTGADHGLVIGAGYARAVAVADRPIVLGGDLTVPWGDLDVGDFRLGAGARTPIVAHDRWRLLGGLAATVRGTRNSAARMIDVGADVSMVAGRYAPRWFAAGELGFDWAITTHVAVTDAYRMKVYADARDGWYGNAGGLLRAGVQAGLSFGRHDLILRAGRLLDVGGNAPMLPIYGTLTFDARW
jgi:hypothetical protein